MKNAEGKIIDKDWSYSSKRYHSGKFFLEAGIYHFLNTKNTATIIKAKPTK